MELDLLYDGPIHIYIYDRMGVSVGLDLLISTVLLMGPTTMEVSTKLQLKLNSDGCFEQEDDEFVIPKKPPLRLTPEDLRDVHLWVFIGPIGLAQS